MIGWPSKTAAGPKTAELHLDDRILPVRLKVSAASRRLTLRYDALNDCVVVTRPKGVPAREALRFARDQAQWVRDRLAAAPPRVPFAPGAEIPLLGVPHVVRSDPDGRRGVRAEGGALIVGGPTEFLGNRLRDWLVREARRELTTRAHALAGRVERKVTRVSIRDTRSRWGSCSADGDLAFSWRLILAPEDVLQYVVAHEVAHLVELNHSHRFWAVVRTLAGDTRAQRAWLKAEGGRLHRYG